MLTAQQFAEKNAVSLDLATRILKALYAKALDAKSLDRVVWRLEDMLKAKELPKLMEALTDDQIAQTIDEMMVQDQSCNDCEVARCNEENLRFWGFSEVAEFAEHKEYKAGDTVEIQIMRAGNWKHPMY